MFLDKQEFNDNDKFNDQVESYYNDGSLQYFKSENKWYGDKEARNFYVYYSLEETTWDLKNNHLLIYKRNNLKIIKLSNDSLILQFNFRREGGRVNYLYTKVKQVDKLNQEKINALNLANPIFVKQKHEQDSLIKVAKDAPPTFYSDTIFSKHKQILEIRNNIETYNSTETNYLISFSYKKDELTNSYFENFPDKNTTFKIDKYFEKGKLVKEEHKTTNSSTYETITDSVLYFHTTSQGKTYLATLDVYELNPQARIRFQFLPDGETFLKMLFNKKERLIQTTAYFKDGVKLDKPQSIFGDGTFSYCNPDGQVCCECEIKDGKIKNCHPIK